MNLATPSGFRDILTAEACERERIERAVQELLSASGFLPIETPTLEVMDVMRTTSRMPQSPFKFFDSRGDLLVMRPDVTMQVARMAATRLDGADGPMRFRYMQRVFREAEGRAQAQAREMTQLGVECIGEAGAQVDAELVGLLRACLAAAGVRDVRLALATVSPLRALLARSGAGEAWQAAVLDAFHTSDFVELDYLCALSDDCGVDVSGVAPAYASAIRALARIRGGRAAIDEARALLEPLGCADGLDEFAFVYDLLGRKGGGAGEAAGESAATGAGAPTANLLIDFSVMSSFDYYTGLVFEAYSPHLGAAIGSGGRYDGTILTRGEKRPAAGFAFYLEQAMGAAAAEEGARATGGSAGSKTNVAAPAPQTPQTRPLRIAVPKGALNRDAIECLAAAGLDTSGLDDPGRQLVIRTPDAEYIIVRPSDAPAFVAFGAADCGICGRDSLLESQAQVVELVDLRFGGCRFVVAEPCGTRAAIEERYSRLGSIRVATKYPNITLAHYARTGVQVDIIKLNGNIELAPLAGMADRIVDITATGTTLRENNLEIVENVLGSTARFFANPAALRTNPRVIQLARALAANAAGAHFDPIAGGTK